MKKKQGKAKRSRGIPLLLPIILVFCILGTFVFSVSHKISREMSASAIQNLSESLNLIKCTIEAILKNESEFQALIAQEIAMAQDPPEYIRSYKKNQTMVKMSLILSGETEGISNTGEKFSEENLIFSADQTVNGMQISQSYLNYMGTWAYSMKCPVVKDGTKIATLYIEYIYDTLDKSLPDGFYNNKAVLYIMDAKSERFVLKPKGMGMRSAGHLNLEDFYRANSIEEPTLRAEVTQCLENGKNILFYHDIRDVNSLSYMWSVNGGSIYLIGYVTVDAIQQESRTVNQNIFIVVAVMLVTFFVCCILYYLNQRQQYKIRKERDDEREIHNKQLREALHAAQIANNSKTTFLSNMSHDIRTPMNAVLGFAALLEMDAENPAKVRKYTKKIMSSGQHLLSLINDVLDVSKIESGKVALNLEKFSLNDVISSVNAIIHPMAAVKNQAFHVNVTGVQHEYLIGDETRINQILINLLSNAVKYTQEGGNIWLRIEELKQRSAQYEHIRIEVEDDGYGMTQEYLKTIFDAFTRAENSTTNKVQGTGLGMAITKNIVELMGGTIDVSSELNKGSLFRVELEFRIPEGQADRQFWKDKKITHILLAESDTESCLSIQLKLKDMGVSVDIARTTEEMMQLLQDSHQAQEDYHLVLFDWNMPGVDGIQTARSLRETLPEAAPILILADFDSTETQEELPKEHIGILTKPFFVSAFKEKIIEMQTGHPNKTILEAEDDNSLEGMRFLAAEDNDINAEILSMLLDVEGASCEIVENGKLALERFDHSSQNEFDAILMDVQMPVMNGYDATKAIRSLARGDAKTIPIIAMTANAFAEDEKAALDAGMNAHVPKPLDIALLKKSICQFVKGKESI